jgi:hypothetical protein
MISTQTRAHRILPSFQSGVVNSHPVNRLRGAGGADRAVARLLRCVVGSLVTIAFEL